MDIKKKKERDARYREKRRNDPNYKKRRCEISKKSYEKRKSSQTSRDKRRQRKDWRISQKKHRMGNSKSQKHVNKSIDPVNATSPRQEAAKLREKSKRMAEMTRLRRENIMNKRKIWRLSKQLKKKQDTKDTPESNVLLSSDKFVLDTMRSKKNIRKCLVAHFSLIKHLSSKPKDKKRLIEIARKISKKYRGLQSYFRHTAKISQRSLSQKKKEEEKAKEPTTEEIVRNFYCRDDNSRNTSGKKETITRKKIKMQKRYLNFSQEVLFEKFESEYPGLVGRSTFYNHRPFWVLRPRINDREMCLCVRCCNIQLMADALFLNNIVPVRDISSLLSKIACSMDDYNCCSSNCESCKDLSAVNYSKVGPNVVKFYKWERILDENNYASNKCQMKLESAPGLVKQFEEMLRSHARHVFNIRNQYKEVQYAKQNLSHDAILINVDFSENYSCKRFQEIQSAHFGNRQQVVIHQGIYYRHGEPSQSFITISDDKRKTADAIAAHLNSILLDIKPNSIKKLIVVSDSPTSQYRNRNMLYLMTQLCASHGLEEYQWIYTEAGHGKGPADGVGALTKRMADQHVGFQGHNIESARDLYRMMISSNTLIKCKVVTKREIDQMGALQKSMKPMKGISNCRQVIWKNQEITYRELACHCRHACSCYNTQKWKF